MAAWRCLCTLLLAWQCSAEVLNDDNLASLLNVMELEQQDQCNEQAEKDWQQLLGGPGALMAKMEMDKAVGISLRDLYDLRVESSGHDLQSPGDPLLNRKLELMLAPGDVLLEVDQWNRLVTFTEEAENALETARDYYCGESQPQCTLSDARRQLAAEKDDAVRRRIKASWEKKLANENNYITMVLPLLKNASKLNGYDTVEKYWEGLVEYEGAVVRAQELWERVRPLYEKLQRHVFKRLEAAGHQVNKDGTIPVRSLGSLLGENWLNVAELVLPKHADVYDVINKNLQRNVMGGREAFDKASKLISKMNLGDINEKFWIESLFNKTCPTRLVDFCQGAVRAFTCNDISLENFLDAHESLMKVKYQEAAAAFSNNTFKLRHHNRYSAVYEAISDLTSLLAVTPQQLERSKLVPLQYFEKNTDHNKLVLQMILALRDLPRLNYYLAVDEWRLKSLNEFRAPIPLGQSWSAHRRSFSLVATGDKDLLGDSYVLHNKPYLAKFFGIILKYQIFQSFNDYGGDVVENIAEDHQRLLEPMSRAFSVKWPELVSDIVAKKEYGVDANSLTDYYNQLDEYLDREQEPNNQAYDNFEQPDVPDMFDTLVEREKIEETENNEIDHVDEVIDQHPIVEPSIHEKEDIRAGEENVLPNKHLIANGNLQNLDEATAPLQNIENDKTNEAGSYNLYLWIGIGVVIAIILILILVIVRKRYNHRKELEKERKEQTRA